MNIHRNSYIITCTKQDKSHNEISTTLTITLIGIFIQQLQKFHLTRCGLMSHTYICEI